jgi:hypothetical protein
MNAEAAVVLFDSVTNRKEYLSRRIEVCEDALRHLVGNERKETIVELDLFTSELYWLMKFQLDFMRALYNGDK